MIDPLAMTKPLSIEGRLKVFLWTSAGLAAGVGAGCMVGPNYRPPVADLPDSFHEVRPAPAPTAAPDCRMLFPIDRSFGGKIR